MATLELGEKVEVNPDDILELGEPVQIDPADIEEQPTLELGEPVQIDPSEIMELGEAVQIDPADIVETAPEEESFFEKVSQGISRGVKETLVPGAVTKEEMEAPKDAVELTSEILTSMGVDIAAGTAATTIGGTAGTIIGGPIGTAVGAAAGLVGYSLYSAIGQEMLTAERTGEFSIPRAGARFILNINPVSRLGGKLAKAFSMIPDSSKLAPLAKAVDKTLTYGEKAGVRAARVAGQAAGEAGVVHSEYGGKAATLAGAVSLVLHGMGFKHGVTPTLADSKLHGIAADPTDLPTELMIGPAIAAKVKKLEEAGDLVYSPDKVTLSIAKTLLGDKTGAKDIKWRAIRDMETKTKAEQDALFADAMTVEAGAEVINEMGPKIREWHRANNTGRKDDLVDIGKNEAYIQHGTGVTGKIDANTGIGATKSMQDVAEHTGKFEHAKTELELLNIKALKKARAAKIAPEQMTAIKLYKESLDPQWRKGIEHLVAEDGSLGGKVKEAFDANISVWDAARNKVRGNEIDMGYIENYVPMKQVGKYGMADQLNDYVTTTDVLSNKIGNTQISTWSLQDLMTKGELGEQAAQDFLDNTKYISSLSEKYFDKIDLSPPGISHLRTKILGADDHYVNNEISAAYTRGGELNIPRQYRELNDQQNLLNYINTNVKSAIMSPALRDAQVKEALLRKMGLDESANWFTKVIQDLNGGTRDNMARKVKDLQQSVKHRINRAYNKEGKNLREITTSGIAKGAMELAGAMQATLYPSLFALNVRAMAKGLVQPLVQSAPEIGGAYGYHLGLKAMLTSPMKYIARLKEDGILSSGSAAEALDPESGELVRRLKGLGQKSLGMYQATDKLSRLWTYSMAHEMSKDLARGNKMALNSLKKLGPAVRAELEKNGLNSLEAFQANQDLLGDILGKYLISKTQFHYGKAHQAEFFRDIGPMFSMFTTWPSAVGTDMYNILFSNKKVKDKAYRFMERYGTQWAALWYIKLQYDEDDKVLSYLDIGPGWTAGPSALDLELFNHPAIKFTAGTYKFAKDLIEGKDVTQTLKSATKQVIKTGTPIGVVLNELDRIEKARKGKTVTSTLVDDLFE